jgi:hypothetical protein
MRRTIRWSAFALVCMSLNGAVSSCKPLSATLDKMSNANWGRRLGSRAPMKR